MAPQKMAAHRQSTVKPNTFVPPIPPYYPPTGGPQEEQETAAEVIRIPFPFITIELSHLLVTAGYPGSPFIIEEDEEFKMSLNLKFSQSSFTNLLMCLGMPIDVTFAVEGFGKAEERNLQAQTIKTEEDKFEYTPTLISTPKEQGLGSGVYKVAAVVSVNSPPVCDKGPLAFGYISDTIFQVYSA